MARKKQYVNFALGKRGGSRIRVKLDGREYWLALYWVELGGYWVLSVADSDGTMLRGGMRLSHAVDVLEDYSDARLPGGGRGMLMAWDFTRRQRDPGRDDLRRTSGVRLVYISIEEQA